MEDRSLQNVIKTIIALPGVHVNTVKTYHLTYSAVRELAATFPRCRVEAELTMLRLLDVMRTENLEVLIVSEEEMKDIARNISVCISRVEFGTVSNPGIMEWILGSIGGNTGPTASGVLENDILGNIGEFMGSEADRVKNLSANDFLARSGNFNEFQKKINKTGEGISEETLKAAIASQNIKAYRSVKEILSRRGIRGISIPMNIVDVLELNVDELEYAVWIAAFYGAEDIVKEEIQEFINSNKRNWERAIPFWLLGANVTAQAKIIRYLLDIAPPVIMNDLTRGNILNHLTSKRIPVDLRTLFPVRSGEISEAIEAWYEKVDNNPNGYNTSRFVEIPIYFAPKFKTKLNGRRLARFIRQIGADADVSKIIYNSLLEPSEVYPLLPIQIYPLNEIRPITDLFPREANVEFDIAVDFSPEGLTGQQIINRVFKYPDGYYEYLTADRGFDVQFFQ